VATPKLQPGANDVRVPLVRARLIASGDLDQSAASESLDYDAQLEAAVRSFQERMGLASDGVIGAGTIAELNVPIADRITQLRVNLDRGRVLLQDLPDEFVIVNIAGFTVYYVRGQQVVWQSRAQVGKPYRRTPIFRSEISYLVLNPTWTVPPGIIEKDILPTAKGDPASITRKGLRVLDAQGREHDQADHGRDYRLDVHRSPACQSDGRYQPQPGSRRQTLNGDAALEDDSACEKTDAGHDRGRDS